MYNCVRGQAVINNYYNCIVNALITAERNFIPKISHKALKPFWVDHLKDLKDKFILWFTIWNETGRPNSGIVFQIKNSVKMRYKLAIKKALRDHDNTNDSGILQSLAKKIYEGVLGCIKPIKRVTLIVITLMLMVTTIQKKLLTLLC